MAKKGMDERYSRHLAEVLRPIVDARFAGNGTHAARAMGISQSHMSQILSSKGAGVNVLVRLRAYTGLSLDELLGLPALQEETELERRIAARVIAEIRERPSSPPLPSPLKGHVEHAPRSRRR